MFIYVLSFNCQMLRSIVLNPLLLAEIVPKTLRRYNHSVEDTAKAYPRTQSVDTGRTRSAVPIGTAYGVYVQYLSALSFFCSVSSGGFALGYAYAASSRL